MSVWCGVRPRVSKRVTGRGAPARYRARGEISDSLFNSRDVAKTQRDGTSARQESADGAVRRREKIINTRHTECREARIVCFLNILISHPKYLIFKTGQPPARELRSAAARHEHIEILEN